MIDPRIAWFAIGATSTAVLFGWPWHPRFSRYSRRNGNGNCVPLPAAPPRIGYRRIYFNVPSQIAECGGPCNAGAEWCNCGALWRDVFRGVPSYSSAAIAYSYYDPSLGEPWEQDRTQPPTENPSQQP